MCPQPPKTELPGRVNCPLVVVHLVFIITIFLQKVAVTCSVQLKIEVHAAFRLEDICARLDHGECKVSEFLHNSYRIDLLDKHNKCTFTIVVASASVSLVCSRRAVLNNSSLASSSLMSETWQDCVV